MNKSNEKIIKQLLKNLMKWLEKDLPDVSEKNTIIAGILGFLLGGIGLGLYFQSWRDFLFPIILLVFLSITLPFVGTGLALIITSGWGIVRADGWPYHGPIY